MTSASGAPSALGKLGTVLFVDDEPAILSSLRRSLSVARFTVRIAGSGAEALAQLEQAPADIVVADVRMPVMNGVELLTRVRAAHPRACRIILSGQVDRETVLTALASGVARSFFTKPWDDGALRSRLEHLLSMRVDIESQGFPPQMCAVDTLPAVPVVYGELTRAVQERRPFARIAQVVERDVGLSAKVLQTINSALYGQSRVASVERAITLLGIDTVQSIAALSSFIAGFDWTPRQRSSLDGIVGHAVRVQRAAAALLRGRASDIAENAAAAGLFHDAGQIMILRFLPERHAQAAALMAAEPAISFLDAEVRLGHAQGAHTRVGAFLLDAWNMPDAVVQAALYHHEPARATEAASAVAHAVWWADRTEAALRAGAEPPAVPPVVGASPKESAEALLALGPAKE
jgi:HD-like signal output (HDOD) protein/ActR/RegA family two-component response regulator